MTLIKNVLKQFGVSATLSSTDDHFVVAVFRLTAWYTLVMTCVLTLFSVAVYWLFRRALGPEPIGEDRLSVAGHLHYDAIEHLFSIILYTDVGCFFITVVLSYFLAKRTLAPLALSYAQQKQFVADTAHELRTPLAVMKAGHEMLLQKDRSVADYRSGVESSLEEINRLVALTNQLLFLSRSSETTVSQSVCELSEVSIANIALLQNYATSKQVTLTADIAPDIVVRGQAEAYGQVIMNLVKNAIDYNRPDGTVEFRMYSSGTGCILTVTDTGIGIPADKIPRIFDRFYKVDTARTASGESGSGLGLSIVKEILTKKNGTISVVSEVGKGTTVTVTIPMM
jgi:signal transduction histidine kinase